MTTEAAGNEQVLVGFTPSFEPPSGDDLGDSPLLEFRGTGHGYEIRGGIGKNSKKPWQRVVFRFIDVEAIQTKEDIYPFPTAEISLFYNDPSKSPRRRDGQGISEWEALSESLRELYGEAVAGALDDSFGGPVMGEGAQPAKPGKAMLWKRLPVLIRTGPNPNHENEVFQKEWHDELIPAWKVLEIEGVGSSVNVGQNGAAGIDPLMLHVLELADGKTPEAFYTAALDDQEVMQNPGLVTGLTNRTFISEMVTLKKLSQDADGTLHKV